MAMLAQQVECWVRGVTLLALEGDEDGSACELQQPAQALPEEAGLLGRAQPGPSPSHARRTGNCGCTRLGLERRLKAPR
jgi:hypothetical protein